MFLLILAAFAIAPLYAFYHAGLALTGKAEAAAKQPVVRLLPLVPLFAVILAVYWTVYSIIWYGWIVTRLEVLEGAFGAAGFLVILAAALTSVHTSEEGIHRAEGNLAGLHAAAFKLALGAGFLVALTHLLFVQPR